MNLLSPILAFMFSIVGDPLSELSPQIDYCSEMEQEIQGRKHAFLAGNKSYYIGGFHPVWNISENETIGLTHPFHNDADAEEEGRLLILIQDMGMIYLDGIFILIIEMSWDCNN